MITMKLTSAGIIFSLETGKTKEIKTKRSSVTYEIKIAFGNDDHGENTTYYDLDSKNIDKFITDYQEFLSEYNYVFCEIIDSNNDYYDLDCDLKHKKANTLAKQICSKMKDLDLPYSKGNNE